MGIGTTGSGSINALVDDAVRAPSQTARAFALTATTIPLPSPRTVIIPTGSPAPDIPSIAAFRTPGARIGTRRGGVRYGRARLVRTGQMGTSQGGERSDAGTAAIDLSPLACVVGIRTGDTLGVTAALVTARGESVVPDPPGTVARARAARGVRHATRYRVLGEILGTGIPALVEARGIPLVAARERRTAGVVPGRGAEIEPRRRTVGDAGTARLSVAGLAAL